MFKFSTWISIQVSLEFSKDKKQNLIVKLYHKERDKLKSSTNKTCHVDSAISSVCIIKFILKHISECLIVMYVFQYFIFLIFKDIIFKPTRYITY